MVDTSIKNTGNSRSLRTVANALTLYPTHEAMIAAMVNGTFPIDLGPLNAAGLTTKGTDLNKASLLTDATAALYGLTSAAVPDDVFKLRFARIAHGSYKGTETNGTQNNPIRLVIGFEPLIVLIQNDAQYFYIGANQPDSIFTYQSVNQQIYTKKADNKQSFVIQTQEGSSTYKQSYIYWNFDSSGMSRWNLSNNSPSAVMNGSVYTYYWIAFG